MTNFQIELYLARMAGLDWSEWKVSRQAGFKAVDELWLFYLAQYEARKEAIQ